MSRERNGTRYTDEVLWLDVREVARQGPMTAGRAWSVTWSRDGRAIGDVRLAIEPSPEDTLLLTLVASYAVGFAGSELVPVLDRFPLESTLCHFGGARWWLRCRRCGKRVAVVYAAGADHRFVCRGCAGLPYRTTRIGELDRIDRRRYRLARRLGYQPSYPRETIHWRHLPRPTRMRPTTYKRLTEEGEMLELRASELWIDQLSAMLSRSDRVIARRYARLGWV